MTNNEFKDALVDVRKAYRLLFLYQKRMLDLIQFIGDSLDLQYNGGWNWFGGESPRNSRGHLSLSSWDFLNLYFYEFNFNDFNGVSFSVLMQSDSGSYIDTIDKTLNIDSFCNVNDSKSKLIFFSGKNCWWEDCKDELFKSDIFKNEKAEFVKNESDKKFISKSFYIDEFINSESTINCLEEWLVFAHKNGIDEFKLVKY